MFENFGPGDIAVFGDMANQNHGNVGFFGEFNQLGGGFADL